ncbi:MAG TPA: ribonucleoside-diphosphate reductase, adenosylcobalamin-dependent, partial [Defluviitaleaceae bacterium]|nr:ribonucleoside-diphosphate reductase, adenosylcobalamin-dependent [Defluviitaleaceae bacterium]
FRDGCARLGILTTDKPKTRLDKIDELKNELDKLVFEQLQEDPSKCPLCGGKLIHSGGCAECQDCGYSPCSI